jgi:hypothetical protein
MVYGFWYWILVLVYVSARGCGVKNLSNHWRLQLKVRRKNVFILPERDA